MILTVSAIYPDDGAVEGNPPAPLPCSNQMQVEIGGLCTIRAFNGHVQVTADSRAELVEGLRTLQQMLSVTEDVIEFGVIAPVDHQGKPR